MHGACRAAASPDGQASQTTFGRRRLGSPLLRRLRARPRCARGRSLQDLARERGWVCCSRRGRVSGCPRSADLAPSPANFVARTTPSAGLLRRPASAMRSRCGGSSPDDDRHEPRGLPTRMDGRPPCASTAGHDCERVRRSAEEDAARILCSHTRTEARDWATDCRSSAAVPPMSSDAFGHVLRGTVAAVARLKGTDATASRQRSGDIKGTAVRKPVDLQGCPASRTYSTHLEYGVSLLSALSETGGRNRSPVATARRLRVRLRLASGWDRSAARRR
jgi:hypothetical protein